MYLSSDRVHWSGFLRADASRLKALYRSGVFVVVASIGCVVLSSAPLPREGTHPDAKQAKTEEQPAKVVTGQDERERQIAEDSARLLKLATDLKRETDKTTFDTLSLGIIRKADEIQKLARNVKTKIKDGQTLAAKGKQ